MSICALIASMPCNFFLRQVYSESLSDREASVHSQHLIRDVARRRRCEEQNGGPDVARLAHSKRRPAPCRSLNRWALGGDSARSRYTAWQYGVHRDPVVDQL